MSTHEHETPKAQRADEPAADAALLAALAELRRDEPAPAALWTPIAARLGSAASAGLRAPGSALATDRRPSLLPALRRDYMPDRDLWPEIEARLRAQRWRRLRGPLATAAALAASLVLGLGLQVLRTSGEPTPPHAPLRASAEVVAAMQESAPERSLRPVSLAAVAPETRALVRANLKIVNSAEAQLKRALASDPDSAYLERLLLAAQQQKQDLRTVLAER